MVLLRPKGHVVCAGNLQLIRQTFLQDNIIFSETEGGLSTPSGVKGGGRGNEPLSNCMRPANTFQLTFRLEAEVANGGVHLMHKI